MGVAGTVVLFNIAAPHTATVRVTKHERKTVQAMVTILVRF